MLEGRCTCVQRLNVRKTTAFGRDRYVLVRKHGGGGGRESVVSRDENAVHTVYVKTSDLRPGSVFGLGEFWVLIDIIIIVTIIINSRILRFIFKFFVKIMTYWF